MLGGLVPSFDEVFCVALARGRAVLERGSIPPALLQEFAEVARRAPSERGRICGLASRPQPRLELHGFSDGAGQRLRNVFGPFARAGLRGAVLHAEGRGRRELGYLAVAVLALALVTLAMGWFERR